MSTSGTRTAAAQHRGGAAREGLTLGFAFARAALCYWLVIYPRTCVELRRRRRRAARIPDPRLRSVALDALAKRANIEGAAAVATLAGARRCGRTASALIAFQALYNHLDTLAEMPGVDRVENARRLHEALLEALSPDTCAADFDALDPQCRDGGYLAELIESCHTSLGELPHFAALEARARSAAARIVSFQSLVLGERGELERWARGLTPVDGGLTWWEAAAAAGSSLEALVLIAGAGVRSADAEHLEAVERAYFPCVGALHSLLDSVVDEAEDEVGGQLSLVRCYGSRAQAAARLRGLAESARASARALRGGARHTVLVIAMACLYLDALAADTRGEKPVDVAARTTCPDGESAAAVERRRAAAELAGEVRAALGGVAWPALFVFKAQRRVRILAGALARLGRLRQLPTGVALDARKRGADAGAA
ncbi:MAG TPA: DUF2600 family protein [Solirubrobacteraceae bacterium]|nr:DUF2600 family protein [Solirubrobacteraceae bacterium]